jgi:hypothetical protein
MIQPEGYIIPGKEFQVCKLMNALYSLRQVSRTWYGRINNYLQKQVGLKRNEVDQNTYFLEEEGKTLIFVLYVYDLLVIGNHESKIKWLIQQLEHTFEVSDLGKLHLYINVEFISLRNGIFMCQHIYILEILQQFGLIHCNIAMTILPEVFKMGKEEDSKLVDLLTFRRIVGKLIYLTNTRPDVVYVVSVISCFTSDPRQVHLDAAKHISIYLKSTSEFEIYYREGESSKLTEYTDADLAGDTENRKSTSGYIFQLGSELITSRANN